MYFLSTFAYYKGVKFQYNPQPFYSTHANHWVKLFYCLSPICHWSPSFKWKPKTLLSALIFYKAFVQWKNNQKNENNFTRTLYQTHCRYNSWYIKLHPLFNDFWCINRTIQSFKNHYNNDSISPNNKPISCITLTNKQLTMTTNINSNITCIFCINVWHAPFNAEIFYF